MEDARAVPADLPSLLVRIARCPNVGQCLAPEGSRHDCAVVVLEQWPTSESESKSEALARRLRLAASHHQLPEPWVGHLRDAPLLFLSSNPSLSLPKNGYGDAERPAGNVTSDWTDERIEHRYNAAFTFMDPTGVSLRKSDGTYDKPVQFWREMRKHAVAIFGENVIPGRDYALTEVVHCKSKGEAGVTRNAGVGGALDTCRDLWLKKVLEHSRADLLIVVGRPARMAFRALTGYEDKATLSEPLEVAGRLRRVAFVHGPTAPTRGYPPRYLSTEDAKNAKAWLAGQRRL